MTSTVQSKSDSAILADLQGLGTNTEISDYATVGGIPTITWNGNPTAGDENTVVAYFQQGNQLGSM